MQARADLPSPYCASAKLVRVSPLVHKDVARPKVVHECLIVRHRNRFYGSSAESVGRIEVLLKEVWVGWGRSAGRRDKALAALGARLPRTVGPGRQPAARVLRCAAVLRMTAATDRAGGPCGPAGRLALDRLAASATAERRSVVAEDRRKRPRTLDAGSAHARPGSCLTMTSSRRPHRRGDDPVPNDRTRPSQQNASRSGNPRQFGVGTPKRRGRRTGCNSRVS